ncbi:MAG: PEGA domain-containing protein [Kofleriaceae bacterium]
MPPPRSGFVLSAAAVWLACTTKSEPPPPQAPPPVAPVRAADAGVPGITTIDRYDPSSGMHVDEDVASDRRAKATTRPGRPIDITLRSSPPGARVAVDGVPLGNTPQLWSGETGRDHEFTFVMQGYAVARYRFVPITSGVVHARLDPIADEESAAGIAPAPLAPAGPLAPPAPPTVISPDAAPMGAPLPVPQVPSLSPADAEQGSAAGSGSG